MIWIVALSMWEAGYRLIGWRADIFPAPSHVLDATLELLNHPTFFSEPLHAGWPWRPVAGDAPILPVSNSWLHIPLVEAPLVSGLRLLGGFAISILLGTILGLGMWRWRELDELLGPLFLGLQTLPSVCWVPLAILVFGLQESGILFVLVMGSCFAISISLRDGLRTIPPVYQSAGLMLGASGWKLYRYVLIPASLPAVTSSLRQGFSFAWRSLMGAELMFIAVDRHGLGYLLEAGRSFVNVKQVVAVMAIMVILGMVVDRLAFAQLERRVHARFGLSRTR
jgi:NitT/TauT family transport system permease protein